MPKNSSNRSCLGVAGRGWSHWSNSEGPSGGTPTASWDTSRTAPRRLRPRPSTDGCNSHAAAPEATARSSPSGPWPTGSRVVYPSNPIPHLPTKSSVAPKIREADSAACKTTRERANSVKICTLTPFPSHVPAPFQLTESFDTIENSVSPIRRRCGSQRCDVNGKTKGAIR